jgi:SAM-dependent methyltransferase
VLTTPFEEFAREQLPAPPARVLDVGCGQGELTTALAVAGYGVLGIDPLAPHRDLFRRITLEDLEDSERFDAVVAGFSLHHIRDLDLALDKIAGLLAPGGVLVVDEFAWDRLDDTTLDWLYGQRRALAAAGHGDVPASHGELRREWEAEHLGLHGFAVRRAGVRVDAAPAPKARRRRNRGARAGADRRRGHSGARIPLRRRRSARLTGPISVTRIGDPQRRKTSLSLWLNSTR